MLIKFILILLVLIVVYLVFFKIPKRGENISNKDNQNNKNGSKNNQKKDAQIMVKCDNCGAFTDSGETIIKDGKYFCSKECAQI